MFQDKTGGYHFPVQDVEEDEFSEVPPTPNQQLVQDEGPQIPVDLSNLMDQVTKMIPRSRIDTRISEGLSLNQPTNQIDIGRIQDHPDEDLREQLDAINNVIDIEVTHENISTVAEDIIMAPESEDDLRKHLKSRSKNGSLDLARKDFEVALAKANRETRTHLETAELRNATIKRLRAIVDGDKTTGETSDSETQGEPEQESEANNLAPTTDHDRSSEEEEGEHDWNLGKEHSDYDIYENMEPDNSPVIPQEAGQVTVTWRPLTLSSTSFQKK